MNDEESIARLMDLAGDGQIITDDTTSNPFQIKEKELPLKERIDLNAQMMIEIEKSRRMSLMQRTENMKPHLPPCLTRATRVLPLSMTNRAQARSFSSTAPLPPSPNTKLQHKDTKQSLDEQSVSSNLDNDDLIESSANFLINPKQSKSTVSTLEGESSISISPRSNSPSNDRPNINMAQTHQTRSRSTNSNASSYSQPRQRPRHQIMSEFIQQKREVFLFQLFINRKKSEISRFAREETTQEKKLKEEEIKISEEIEMYKRSTVQLEAALARSRHQAEIAAQMHSTLIKNLHHSETNISLIKSDISKNEDLLETYRPYLNFLLKFIPDDMTVFQFFKDPSTLIEELHRIENENLLLIKYCQHFEQVFSNGVANIDQKLIEALKEEEKVIKNIQSIETVDDYSGELSKRQKETQEEKEDQLKHLSGLIRKTYIKCFGVDADIGPLPMLEKIENQFENMFAKIKMVDPEFLAMKKAIKDAQRREKQRKERNEKREMEQQRKIENAIERAKRPIPRKTGRPMNSRLLPITIIKPDDEAIKMKKYAEMKELELLFGEEL
ncbi:hypothetical protein TRFO_06029 [Tritrichomonas foetus]|uniref:DUF4200 domain-containing protein n=1 Tax=Tritrichomonas foetus TaxID=1144522 RepID=A0A1J4K5T9_9EUKA|nr:hypothetical protein TRFO_06029 [Tritrichomonas foetus]|eukprot:OHT05046.1 hypothetical protein TRFO_06029 [Tritrichomonas foetus]